MRARAEVAFFGDSGKIIDGDGLVSHTTQAFIARNGVEPRAELRRVTELADTFGGEQKCFLNRIGGIVW